MIQPPDFIPLAEQTRLIVPIGDWVLRTACSEAAGWSRKIRIAVNLSAVQFKNRKLVESVQAALSESGLAPDRLELEITETILFHDYGGTLATPRALRNLGVRISMDDFGTGYSSLSYLQSFPFDKIKIDQSFIRELANREESMAIVRAIAVLAKASVFPPRRKGSRPGSSCACCGRRAARRCKDISLARRARQLRLKRCFFEIQCVALLLEILSNAVRINLPVTLSNDMMTRTLCEVADGHAV